MAELSIEQALAKIPFLSGLTADERARIARNVVTRDYPEGATIVARGDNDRTLYILIKGRVRVLHPGEGDEPDTPLAELGPGEFFGEMALLENRPRSANVVALTDVTCVELSYEVFCQDLLGNHEVGVALLAALSRRLRALNELVERPHVETPASPEERERRILTEGETAIVGDIRTALVIKEHNHFSLFDPEGNIPVANTIGLGLYVGDTRHLSGYEISLGQVQPVVLVSTARLGYAAEQQLVNRDLMIRSKTVRKETLLVSRQRLAHDAGFYEQITLHNFNLFPVEVELSLHFAADFADIFEVRGMHFDKRGAHRPAVVEADTVTLAYDGLDERVYRTALTFEPPPTELTGSSMRYLARVDALGQRTVNVRITGWVTEPGGAAASAARRIDAAAHDTAGMEAQTARAQHSYDDWQKTATRATTENELLNAALTQSLADLRLLVGRLGDQWYFAAGTPWFATLFGRDSLITGLQTLAWNPDLAAGILRLLARYQGTTDDAWRDEEPGKILHELRTGELARTNRVPHSPYYGTIDATPLFLMLAAEYYDWTGDADTLRAIRPNIDAALAWCIEWGDRDGDGYVEYTRRSNQGLVNQGWRDSGDGIMFRDGRLPNPPIALVEVQAYLYAAYRGIARALRALGEGEERVADLEARAAALKERFNRDFWLPEDGFYALGLDGQKAPIDAPTSNPGHALWTGLIADEREAATVARLLDDDLFSGWGVRTLGLSGETYNPLGYHLGTVWPHDNSIIVAGMQRRGFRAEANRLFTALYEAALHFPYYRLPELFCGMARTTYGVPIGYPVACSPQAWSAATLPYMLAETLGLRPRDGGRTLEIVRPLLPDCSGDVTLRGLRVGGARLDLTFARTGVPGEPAQVTVAQQSGAPVEVSMVDTPALV